jgi:transcriptional regulator with XRE-family HTH domain
MPQTWTAGEALRAVRQRRGLTQRQLAARMGVDHAQIARMESGKAQPNVRHLERLAIALQITPALFLELTAEALANLTPFGADHAPCPTCGQPVRRRRKRHG